MSCTRFSAAVCGKGAGLLTCLHTFQYIVHIYTRAAAAVVLNDYSLVGTILYVRGVYNRVKVIFFFGNEIPGK